MTLIAPLPLLALLGFLLSLYTLFVEWRLKHNGGYSPVCDISATLSCSRSFKSPYGHVFGVSNALPGLGFYASVFGLYVYGRTDLLLFLTVPSILFSAYLAYVSFFKIKSSCPVCLSIYAVNLGLLVLSVL